MTAEILYDVLEATGYVANGQPAPGVHLGEDVSNRDRTRDFIPDALWRGETELAVYFKYEPETPSDDEVAQWRRTVWNKGFVPLLWVVSPETICLYNGFGRPRKEGDADKNRLLRTFRRIEKDLDELDSIAGRLAMETGEFWRRERRVNRRTSVDRQLLSDLARLEHDLTTDGLDRPIAQGLIGRSIFTQYLIDREIVTSGRLEHKYGHETLADILRDRPATEQLFNWLRERFNGDMFPSGGVSPPDKRYLNRVADFLDAIDPGSGQLTFFPYRFDVIPVELISSIYEQFAHSDKPKNSAKPETSTNMDVFYTRLSLVSLVLDEVMQGLTGEETVLDLACGSGIFLVEALRRLVDLRSGGDSPNRETVRSTLYNQIYGVDISAPAVQVAAFSLYLAALELDPTPEEAPKFEPLIGNTLIVGDAWHVEETSAGRDALTEQGNPKTFDLIVGNPPWSYPGKSGRAARQSTNTGNDSPAPRGVSLDFAHQSLRFASDETRFGLVLSAVQFFSRSSTGRAASHDLIERLSPVTLVNLSHQSSWLFAHSKSPAIVLFARHRRSDSNQINAVRVPWSPSGAQTHTFEISRDDVVTLPLAEWRRKPEFLKAAFFGLRRDLALLEKLTSDYASLGSRFEELGTKLRMGLIVGNRSQDSSFLHGLPLIKKESIGSFSVPEDLPLYEDKQAQWPRSRGTYRAPLLLVRQSLENPGRPVAAICRRDAVFTDSVFGASLPSGSADIAGVVAAILNSSFASWFFLMTASTFGIRWRRLLPQDVEHIPTPDFQILLHSRPGRLLGQIARKFALQRATRADWFVLDEAVFDLYQLNHDERIVARDGLFRATWQWREGRLQSAVLAEIDPHIMSYASAFLGAVGIWLSAGRRIRAEVFEFPASAPLRVVRFVMEESHGPSAVEVVQPGGNLRDVLRRIGERLDVPLGASLVGQRALRVSGPNEVVIIKPAARRHWMEVSALEDADAVIAESMSGAFV